MLVLSPLFTVEKTSYGGRGCFSSVDIDAGTTVLACDHPISSTILRTFKKEVCLWCFHYDNGRTLKLKAAELPHFYFCSPACLQRFEAFDTDRVYLKAVIATEENYIRVQKQRHPAIEAANVNITSSVVEAAWQQVEQWERALPRSPAKRLRFLPPHIDINELMEAKYVLGCLFDTWRRTRRSEAFELLQSDELLKLTKYPYLLELYTRVYKLVRLSLDAPLAPLLTTTVFRDAIGKNLSNAFGIWSQDPTVSGREFFGYSVYPEASYFNHSCEANLTRERIGRRVVFSANRAIAPGEELCICYGNAANENAATRQKELDEWHFTCQCPQCQRERNT
jgi:hypothetical protein